MRRFNQKGSPKGGPFCFVHLRRIYKHVLYNLANLYKVHPEYKLFPNKQKFSISQVVQQKYQERSAWPQSGGFPECLRRFLSF